jgi:hypothetical protein
MPKQQNDADIFDRSFKKIIGSLSSRALIRFINGLFGSNHPPDRGGGGIIPREFRLLEGDIFAGY